jgi:hypothetical protein
VKSFIKKILRESYGSEGKLFYHGSPYAFDKFEFEKIGSGDGLNKYGYGLYFSDNIETAVYYAKELSIGTLRATGLQLYTVKLFGLESFYEWENEMNEHVYNAVIHKLKAKGFHEDAEQIESEFEEYGTYWSLRNIYEYLTHSLGSPKETTEFLNLCGVNGVIAQSPAHDGNVYVAYSDDVIKIINVEKI